MAQSTPARRMLRFGVYELDLAACELRKYGARIRLQYQPCQILVLLLERPGEVVTREELRQKLWPDGTFVDFEHSLNAAVKKLREAIGDDADNPRFVETVPRRGYRFIAPVNSLQYGAGISKQALGRNAKHRMILIAAVALLLVMMGIGWRFWPGKTQPWGPSAKRLTTNPTENPINATVLSPNGETLLYSDSRGLWLRVIKTGETRQVHLPNGFTTQPQAWLPDGIHVIVVRDAEPGQRPSLWTVSILGGEPRRLAERAAAAAVSPDGAGIAMLRGEQDDREIWVVDADGANPRKLYEVPVGESIGPPAWSPTGRRLAFVRRILQPDHLWELVALDVKSGKTKTVLSANLAPSICWLSDGNLIYGLRKALPDRLELWSVPFAGDQSPAGQPIQIALGYGRISSISASADGKRLVYLDTAWQSDIYVGQLGGGGMRIDGLRRLTMEDSNDIPFSWTANGKEVIFVSDRNGGRDIFRQRIDAYSAEPLVISPEAKDLPRIDPTGTRVLYLSLSASAHPESGPNVMVAPLAGGPARALLQQARIGNIQCARAPANVCVMSVLSSDKVSFYSLDLEYGRGPLLLELKTRAPWNDALSPDGSKLAFANQGGILFGTPLATPDEAEITVFNLRDRSRQTIRVHGRTALASLDWAADGKGFFAYSIPDGGPTSLLRIEMDGTARKLWQQAKTPGGWAIPSPDGRHVALTAFTLDRNAWMLARE